MKKYLIVFITVLFIILAAGCGSDSSDDKQENSNISADSSKEGYSRGGLEPEVVGPTPTEIPTPIIEETPESEEKVTKLEDARNKDSDEEEYQKALAKQEAEETTEPHETSSLTGTSVPKETQKSTTIQLSEAKKKELIGIIKEYYNADKVEVDYFSPKDASDAGLMSVTYYLAVPPAKSTLENDLFGIVWASKGVAEESGIKNTNVNVVSMLTDETTPLGVGNYYSATEKTDIHVEDINV